jgi:hypothetical protein
VGSSPEYDNREADIVTQLRARDSDNSYTDAIQRLESLKSSNDSTCFEIATALVADCQAIGGKPGHSNAPHGNPGGTLDALNALYAARLAICQRRVAGASIPSQCHSIFNDNEIITRGNSKQWWRYQPSPGHEDITINSEKVIPCTAAMDTRPQWWTSYHGNLQNAGIWCALGRMESEKNKMLHNSKSVIEVMSDASSKLAEAVELHGEQLSDQKLFAEQADSLMSAHLQHILIANETFDFSLQHFVSELQSILLEALSSAQNFSSSVNSLKKVILPAKSRHGIPNTAAEHRGFQHCNSKSFW